MDDEQLLRRFENRTLALECWTHRAHLRVAYLYLTRHGFDEALARMRAGILAFNTTHGVVATPTSGYHETMTCAWMQLLHTLVVQYGPADSADGFLDAQPELLEKRVLRFFYSRDLIMSARARESFVAPDLAPLPRPLDADGATD